MVLFCIMWAWAALSIFGVLRNHVLLPTDSIVFVGVVFVGCLVAWPLVGALSFYFTLRMK
jgi:hypothetical protein